MRLQFLCTKDWEWFWEGDEIHRGHPAISESVVVNEFRDMRRRLAAIRAVLNQNV